MDNNNRSSMRIVSAVALILIAGFLFYQRSKIVTTNEPVESSSTSTSPASTASTSDAIAPTTTSVSGEVNVNVVVPQVTLKTFTVTGSNYSFAPATLSVNKGDKVRILFKNSGGNHDLRIDEFNVSTKMLSSGQSETIEFIANKTGSFEYYCSVGQHRQMGMKGALIVK